jgi:hypothetical protein
MYFFINLIKLMIQKPKTTVILGLEYVLVLH